MQRALTRCAADNRNFTKGSWRKSQTSCAPCTGCPFLSSRRISSTKMLTSFDRGGHTTTVIGSAFRSFPTPTLSPRSLSPLHSASTQVSLPRVFTPTGESCPYPSVPPRLSVRSQGELDDLPLYSCWIPGRGDLGSGEPNAEEPVAEGIV